MLCGFFHDLTVSHVFPRSVGNNTAFKAYGYNVTSSGEFERLLPTRFPKGISFRTLCQRCNSSLGSNEDKVIKDFFCGVTDALRSTSVILPDPWRIRTRPGRLFRAALAYLVTANNTGRRTRLDGDVKKIFEGSVPINQSTLRLYYWPYTGPWLTVIRDIMVSYKFFKEPIWLNILKFKPVGFAITDSRRLFNLPCLNAFFSRDIDDLIEIPLWRAQQENDIHWPASPGPKGAVLCSSESPNLVAAASWRSIKPRSNSS